MTRVSALVLVTALLAASGWTGRQSAASEQTVDIWAAAAKGNLEAIKQQLAAGKDINAKVPSTGVTPLMMAAITRQSDAATLLLAKRGQAGYQEQ